MNNQVYRLLALCARAECTTVHLQQLTQEAAKLGLEEWAGLPAGAEAHGMAPLLYTHLKSAGVELPLAVRRQLQGLYARHRDANRVRTRVLRDIVTACQDVGISVLVLKGAALSHLVYPQPGLRPMSDLDILVPESELGRTQVVLAGLGFNVPAPSGPMPAHRHLPAATLRAEGLGIAVEVHYKLLSDYFDHALAYLHSRVFSRGRIPLEQAPRRRAGGDQAGPAWDGLTAPPRPFAVGDLTAYTLSYEEMLRHLCQHLSSHVNVWDFGRLIWAADVVSLAERFAGEIDWERVQRRYPAVLDTLSLLHCMTPLSEELLDSASIRIGRAPQGIGEEFQGWPRIRRADWQSRGYRRVLRDTLCPSEWWLRLRYQLGSARRLFWYRWVRHPLHILGHVMRAWLERLGWPRFPDLAGG